jgi:UDPglucose 6-dehydrogenase
MNVTVFGSGYVGLVTAACFANAGNNVLCVDIDREKVELLTKGIVPIHEPGLADIIRSALKDGAIGFTTDAERGVAHASVIFIAVGTPPDEDGSADLQHVLQVAGTVGRLMTDQKFIVNKSTVPVGTGDKVETAVIDQLRARNLAIDFDVISNPEFLKEGAAVADFMKPDRIVIGTDSDEAESVMRQLYSSFNRNHEKIIVMDRRSSELTKYAANAMLATKISFMNEIALIAEQCNADIEHVRKGIGSDPRIGYHFIYPGCGYGGSCFPKDVKALVRTAGSMNIETRVLDAVEERNESQKALMYSRLDDYFGGQLQGRTIAIWGLAFKPNTDDMREAPSRKLMEALWQAGAVVQGYDPVAMHEARRLYPDVDSLRLYDNAYKALQGADALCICTEWRHFTNPDFAQIRQMLKQPLVVDGRNLFDPVMMETEGFDYLSVGRPQVQAMSADSMDSAA